MDEWYKKDYMTEIFIVSKFWKGDLRGCFLCSILQF